MEGQYREYKNTLAHKDITKIKSKCDHMETYSEELEIGKKKVKITIDFPYTVDPRDAERFEHMLKEIYLNIGSSTKRDSNSYIGAFGK